MTEPMTCQQCLFAEGRWSDEVSRAVLMCLPDNRPAPGQKCSRFEREPGTQEREEN